jgi:hypothetical protein
MPIPAAVTTALTAAAPSVLPSIFSSTVAPIVGVYIDNILKPYCEHLWNPVTTAISRCAARPIVRFFDPVAKGSRKLQKQDNKSFKAKQDYEKKQYEAEKARGSLVNPQTKFKSVRKLDDQVFDSKQEYEKMQHKAATIRAKYGISA